MVFFAVHTVPPNLFPLLGMAINPALFDMFISLARKASFDIYSVEHLYNKAVNETTSMLKIHIPIKYVSEGLLN